MGIRELRPELFRKCDILQAILAFNYALTESSKRSLDNTRKRIPIAPAKELREIRDRLNSYLRESTKKLGCVKNPEEFAAEFITATRAELGVPNVEKKLIDESYFTSFCYGNDAWGKFPPHLRLQVHFEWVVSDPLVFHYILPEAILYEDMCVAFNLAYESSKELKGIGFVKGGNPVVKQHSMHLRTAVLSAYYFVEAYLNGIAFDYHYRNGELLAQRDKDLLMEWDSQANRQKFVSFEAKIKGYQKLILKTSTGLDSSNCRELKILLGDAREIRDAIVHQSPKTTESKLISDKVRNLLSLDLGIAEEVVDSAVEFVKKLNERLGSNGIDVNWLHGRNKVTGLFPKEALD
jgi:hypothetical protein